MRILGLVSFVQLLLGVAGLKKSLREGRVADVPFAEKRSKKELQQRHWTDGTALSAPTPMLILQGIASIVLIVHPRPPKFFARLLGVLGAVMAIGYPVEKVWRDSLVEPDRKLTPLTFGGFLLALKMAILGWSVGRGRRSRAVEPGDTDA
ncbi:hypothetical protein EV187_0669 [Agromyces ramosus]|jgi:hypothetical protein|uniref:Uncharacterized protein n=1 Tax=Agromyces ramosus TaxID=33879 RepID=A0A4Q7MN84_9MICO|nr:hypothetical protein [Agromyces ramosus]RZS68242.1 hypothetical protein EV187_0669 [Agromyces ramosus]